jgi:hypothetical protein
MIIDINKRTVSCKSKKPVLLLMLRYDITKPVTIKLATSFELNSSDFTNVFDSLIKDKSVDLLVAEKEQDLIGSDMYLSFTIQHFMQTE